MTLKQIEALYWAAALGSFALAAERLHMTQSSLSKRIAELEDEIGEKLFDRSGSRARITEVGERLLGLAQQMLNLRDEILTTARGTVGLRGTCHFGVSELVALTWLPDLVARVRKAYPEVILQPRVAVAQELLESVVKGETDFAIGPGGSPDALMASLHLTDVEMLWVCAPSLLPEDAIMTTALIQEYPVISMSAQSGATAALDNWAIGRGLKFKRIVTSNSMGAVAALAVSGMGICLLPGPYAREFIERGRLRRLQTEERLTVPTLAYHLHWRKDNTSVLSRAVRDIALAVAESPIGSPFDD